jgi:uncharacterized protein YegJ (DUF2314 family)
MAIVTQNRKAPLMFRTFVLLLGLLLPVVAFAQQGDPVTGFAEDDPEMTAAVAQAGQTLPLFLKNATDADGFGVAGTSVKVAFPATGGGSEVIWVGPFRWDGDQNLAGLLANQPNFMGGLNAGDPVDFTVDMVRDWALQTSDGMLSGHYTTRVILPRLDPAQAAQLSAMLSKNPVPESWR